MRRRFNARERHALRVVSGNRCENCGAELGRGFHADHKSPFARGGETTLANGQALCPNCNLKKGTRPMSSLIDPTCPAIAGRDWQQAGLRAMREAYATGRDFLEAAAPSTGKTRFGIAAMRSMKDEALIDLTIVVAPKNDIVDEWQAEAQALAGLRLKAAITADDFRNVEVEGVPPHVDGYVVTYAMLASVFATIEALCTRYRVLFVADEIHHAGEGMTWGNAVLHSADRAAYRLGLTGTPYRADANRIPFLQYDAEVGVPHHEYSYGEALHDKVVAPIVFEPQGGSVIVTDSQFNDGERTVLVFGEELDEQDTNARLRYALHGKNPWLHIMLRSANARLQQVRETTPNAGGLVIGATIEQARLIERFMRTQMKVSTMLVTNEDGDPQHIREFRDGDVEWLVSVKMVSEGSNVPRLRVLAYASNYTAELYFNQALGRITRLDNTLPNGTVADVYEQAGYVFMPSDPRLLALAATIEEQVTHELKKLPEREGKPWPPLPPKDDKRKGDPGDPFDGPHIEFFPEAEFSVDGEAVADGVIVHGRRIPQEEIDALRTAQAAMVQTLESASKPVLAKWIGDLHPVRFQMVQGELAATFVRAA